MLHNSTDWVCVPGFALHISPERDFSHSLRLIITLEIEGQEVGCPMLKGFILCMAGAGQECSFIVFCFTSYLPCLGQKEKEELKVTFFLVLCEVVENTRAQAACHGHVSMVCSKGTKGGVDQLPLNTQPVGQGPPPPLPCTHFLLAHGRWARSHAVRIPIQARLGLQDP